MTRIINTKNGQCIRCDADGEWITLPNGTHVHLTEGGAVDKGPENVKKEFNGRMGKTKFRNEVHDRANRLIHDLDDDGADTDYIYDELPMGTIISVVGLEGGKKEVEVRKGIFSPKAFVNTEDSLDQYSSLGSVFGYELWDDKVDWSRTKIDTFEYVKDEDLEKFSDYITELRKKMYDDDE